MAVLDNGKNDIPMFLAKLWSLVENPKTDSLIRWSTNGSSFVVPDPANFAKHLLPQYFKHRNMASFIRVLNMYGFRKVVKLDSGSLKSSKDDMEFQHPCFVRGSEHLLVLIKRKATTGQAASHKTVNDELAVSSNPKIPEQEVSRVLNDVRFLRNNQEAMDAKLQSLKRENEALWTELQDLRTKHQHQQIVVNKVSKEIRADRGRAQTRVILQHCYDFGESPLVRMLNYAHVTSTLLIEFFVTLLQSTENVANTLRAPHPHLAIQDIVSGGKSPKHPRIDNAEGVGGGGKQGATGAPESYAGPIIHDVTDAYAAAYPQQQPEEVDWDRLLDNDNSDSSVSTDMLRGLTAGSAARPGIGALSAPFTSQHPPENQAVVAAPYLPHGIFDLLIARLKKPSIDPPATLPAVVGPPRSSSTLSPQLSDISPVASPISAAKRALVSNALAVPYVPDVRNSSSIHTNQGTRNGNGRPATPSGANAQKLDEMRNLLQSVSPVDSSKMVHQVDSMQASLDSIRDLLQDPSYSLDFSQILQLFPEPRSGTSSDSSNHGAPPIDQSAASLQNGVNNHMLSDGAIQDETALFLDDGDDFMRAFDELPGDDMIEGVTIQIPEYPSENDTSSPIPLPPLSPTTSPPIIASTKQTNKRKRKI